MLLVRKAGWASKHHLIIYRQAVIMVGGCGSFTFGLKGSELLPGIATCQVLSQYYTEIITMLFELLVVLIIMPLSVIPQSVYLYFIVEHWTNMNRWAAWVNCYGAIPPHKYWHQTSSSLIFDFRPTVCLPRHWHSWQCNVANMVTPNTVPMRRCSKHSQLYKKPLSHFMANYVCASKTSFAIVVDILWMYAHLCLF